MRVDEALVKNCPIPLKTRPAAADEDRGMADLDEGIVELYAEHLSRKAASVVVTMAVGGAIGGAVLGTVPGLLSHSVISPGANYFAVLLGAIAGGFLGRSLGEKRAVGYRLQAKACAPPGGGHAPSRSRRCAARCCGSRCCCCRGPPRPPSRRPSGPRRHRSRRRRSHPRFSRRHPRLRRSSPRHPFRLESRRPPRILWRGTRTHARTRAAPAPMPAPLITAAPLSPPPVPRRDGACSREAHVALAPPPMPVIPKVPRLVEPAPAMPPLSSSGSSYARIERAGARRWGVAVEALERVGDAQRDLRPPALRPRGAPAARARSGRVSGLAAYRRPRAPGRGSGSPCGCPDARVRTL